MKKKYIIYYILLLIVATVLLILSTQQSPRQQQENQPPEPRKLKIATTILPLYLTTKEVAGDLALVENLIPLNIPPYQLKSSAEADKRLSQTDLLVVSDTDLDAWADSIVQTTNFDQNAIVHAGKKFEHLPSLPVIVPNKRPDRRGVKQYAPTKVIGSNPYYWLDAGRMIRVAETIRDALIAKDPAHQRQYWINTSAFFEQLTMIDRDIRERAKGFKSKTMASMYPYLTYFVQSYDMEWVGALAESPSSSPNREHLSLLKRQMLNHGVEALFVPLQIPSWMNDFARETDTKFYVFDPIEYATSTDITYNSVMRKNITALSEGLGYEPQPIN